MLKRASELVSQFGEQAIFDTLLPMIADTRVAKIKDVISKRIKHVHMACESPYDIHNAFATIRTAEAFGAYNVHIVCNNRIKSTGKATTQGAKRWVFSNYYYDSEHFFNSLPQGMAVAGASLEATHSLDELPIDKPICLLFGNEHKGLSDFALSRCDYRFKLPMYGMSQSFNLSIAGALTLSKIVERYRTTIAPTTTDLSEAEQTDLLAHYLLSSFGVERAAAVLKRLG